MGQFAWHLSRHFWSIIMIVQPYSTNYLRDASGDALFTAAETGLWNHSPAYICSFEAIMGSAGTTTATVEIHGSNSSATTPSAGTLLGTIILSGSGDTASFTTSSARYKYKCAKITALGAGATVSVLMGD
jgi:hypothetical protein